MDTRKQLIDWHLAPPKEKSDPAYGKIMAMKFLDSVRGASVNYFTKRNERIKRNREIAKGQQNMDEFLDLMKIEGKNSYVNLDMKPPPIAPKFVEILIARFMERLERPTVTAVDEISKGQKQRKRDEAEFRMHLMDEVAGLEEAAGFPLEAPDAFVPEDKDELELHFEIEDKEIDELRYEQGVWDVLQDNDYDNYKERILNDAVKAGIMVSEVYLDENKRIRVSTVLPENAVYGYSSYDDFHDCTIAGKLVKMKVSDLRRLYPMPEQKLYELYRTSSQSPEPGFGESWSSDYIDCAHRPYDDAVIEILDFELITTDPKMWVKKSDKNGRMVLEDRKEKPKNLENKELLGKMVGVVYHGVIAVGGEQLIKWELCENMIKPHHALHQVFGRYVVTMIGNDNMENMAVVERMENSITQMTISLLKMQQLKSELRPDELAINATALSAIDLGEGILEPFQIQAIFQQTGKLFYNGTLEDGQTREAPPITALPMSSALQKMQALMNDYQFHLQLLRDMIGMNEASDGTGVGERMGMGVMQNQIGVSNRATDFVYSGYITHLNGVAKRIAILLWWNITGGSRNYKEVASADEIKDKIYDLQISLLPTDADRQYIEALLQTAMANGFTLEEVMKVRRLSKVNVKLAEKYLAHYEKKRRENTIRENQANIQATSEAQQASNQQTHDNAIQLKQLEMQGKTKLEELKTQATRTQQMADLVKAMTEQPALAAMLGQDKAAQLLQSYVDNLLGVQQIQNMGNAVAAQNTQMELQQQAMQQAMMQQQQ